jgi:Pyruvate/2-oxoacid:ferredoxin oxidoreductase gamma subunit
MSTALDLPQECWQKAIAECVKPKFLQINTRAFEEGRQLAVGV